MSTYLEKFEAIVSLKPVVSVECFEEELRNRFSSCVSVDQNKDGTVTVFGGDDVGFNWEDHLSEFLEEFCDSWDVEAQEEMCDPLRFYKEKGGEATVVSGTELVYYPSFEDEFIKRIPPKVIQKVIEQHEK